MVVPGYLGWCTRPSTVQYPYLTVPGLAVQRPHRAVTTSSSTVSTVDHELTVDDDEHDDEHDDDDDEHDVDEHDDDESGFD